MERKASAQIRRFQGGWKMRPRGFVIFLPIRLTDCKETGGEWTRTARPGSGMLDACEHSSSFCGDGVIGGSPDRGGRYGIRSRVVAVEVATGWTRQAGRTGRQERRGKRAAGAPPLTAAAGSLHF